MRTLIGVFALAIALTTAGAVARQALQLNSGPIMGWQCPHCGAGNAGDPQATFRAVCRVCGDGQRWEAVAAVTGDDAHPPATVAR